MKPLVHVNSGMTRKNYHPVDFNVWCHCICSKRRIHAEEDISWCNVGPNLGLIPCY